MPTQAEPTRQTLLVRVRDAADAAAWAEFDARYRELILRFARSRGLQAADAEDVAQQVLSKLVTGLRSFEYDPAAGRFRQYLYRCVRRCLADFWSRQAREPRAVCRDGDGPPSGAGGDADVYAAFEREWVDHHYRLALAAFQVRAETRTLRVLEATLRGVAARAIGEDLGMSEAAVHKAQQRIRDALRALIAEQLRDEDAGRG